MIFAGAIELDPETVFLILAVAIGALLAYAAIGGLLAAGIAGSRRAFPLGALACGGTAFLLGRSLGLDIALLAGLASGALVGLAYRGPA